MVTEAENRLFDVTVKELDPYWVNPNQPLKIPQNPLHYEAYKLQLLLEKLDLQLKNSPAQFNSTTYLNILTKFSKLCEAINSGAQSVEDISDEKKLDPVGNSGAAAPVGEGAAPSVGYGVSADNPAAG